MTATTKLALLGALALTAASCTLISGKGTVIRAESASAEAARDHSQAQTQAPAAAAAATHRPAVTRQSSNSRTSTMLDGEWEIIRASGRAVEADVDRPYVNFAGGQGRFYASNGCNVLNGAFSLDGSSLTLSHVLSTMRLCADYETEQAINAVIKDGASYTVTVSPVGDESELTLKKADGSVAMTLRRHNLERLDGQWAVSRVGDRDVDGEGLDLFLDLEEKSVHGSTGCNYFNGTIETDLAKDNAISFSGMAATMRACPNSDLEMAMLVALEETCTYSLDGQHLTLYSREGSRLMQLRRPMH